MTQQPDNASADAVTARLQQIRERAQAITPGEWSYDQMLEVVRVNDSDSICLLDQYWQTDADGFFIAHAPADIRFLLDELDRRERDNARLRDQLAAATGALQPFADIGLVEAYTVMTAIGRTETETLMKLAKQTATSSAGAEEDGR